MSAWDFYKGSPWWLKLPATVAGIGLVTMPALVLTGVKIPTVWNWAGGPQLTDMVNQKIDDLTTVTPAQQAKIDADNRTAKAQADKKAAEERDAAAKSKLDAENAETAATNAQIQAEQRERDADAAAAEKEKAKTELDKNRADAEAANAPLPPSGQTQIILSAPGQPPGGQGGHTPPPQMVANPRNWQTQISPDGQSSCTAYPLNVDAAKGRDGIYYIVLNRGVATFTMLDNEYPIKATSNEMWTMVPKTNKKGTPVVGKDGEPEFQLVRRDESTPSSAMLRRDYNEVSGECNRAAGREPAVGSGRPSTRYMNYPPRVVQ